MKDLTISQEFLLLTLPQQGYYHFRTGHYAVELGLVSASLVDLVMGNVIEIGEKELKVSGILPEKLSFLVSLYNGILNKKLGTLTKLAQAATSGYRPKLFRQLESSLIASVASEDFLKIEEKPQGIVANQGQKQVVERIRAELLEGNLADESAVLVVLLNESKRLAYYFSEFEIGQIKERIRGLKDSQPQSPLIKLLKIVASNQANLMGSAAFTQLF